MVLEDRVQPQHHNVLLRKCIVNSLGLWNTVRHATGAKHLERLHDYNLAKQVIQGKWLWRVEPAISYEGRS